MIKTIHSVGKRKTSIARVYIREKYKFNKIIINNIIGNKYFKHELLYYEAFISLFYLNMEKLYIFIRVNGGGENGQAGAISLGLSKGICELYPKYKYIFKKNKLLTRDSRKVERKKFGYKKSRKSFQFSKR